MRSTNRRTSYRMFGEKGRRTEGREGGCIRGRTGREGTKEEVW